MRGDLLAIVIVVPFALGLQEPEQAGTARSVSKATLPVDRLPATLFTTEIPLGLPSVIPAPADNPLDKQVFALGRKLFFDPLLSVDRTVSCASCHRPAHTCAPAPPQPTAPPSPPPPFSPRLCRGTAWQRTTSAWGRKTGGGKRQAENGTGPIIHIRPGRAIDLFGDDVVEERVAGCGGTLQLGSAEVV